MRSNAIELRSYETRAIAFLALAYLAGVAGIHFAVHASFILLTPFNLLLSLVLALVFHRGWTKEMSIFLALCYAVGFGAELFGVQTGLLFGEYAYGPVLGPKVWGTPLMIGVNWMLVSYTTGMTVNAIGGRWHWAGRAVAGALLMVILDLFIEPVAMAFNFWSWEGDVVPLRNYFGWFFVSLPLQAYFAFHFGEKRNKVAVALFIMQLAFFVLLGMLNINFARG